MPFAVRARALRVLTATTVFSALLLVRTRSASADTAVQIPVDSLLDGRSVSTLSGTTIVPWSAGQGVDGDGNADGFVTSSVEALLQTQNKTENGKLGVALPDDGTFPETTRHPEIVLHFSNMAASTSPQTHQVHISQGPQSFQFAVPPATYSKLFLVITCSEGAAALTVTLSYAGGAAPTVTQLMLPDYGIGGAQANDAVFFNLISGMDKWSTTDQEGDGPSHTITGIELSPTPSATLTGVQVAKTNGSHAVFWGATGIATSAVSAGGAGGAAGNGGVSGESAASGGSSGNSAANGGATAAAGASTMSGAAGSSSSGRSGASSNSVAGSAGMAEAPGESADSGGCSLIRDNRAATRNAIPWASLLAACVFARRRRGRAAYKNARRA